MVKISVREETYKRVFSQILMELTDTIQRYFNIFLQNEMSLCASPTPSLRPTAWLPPAPKVTVPTTRGFLRKDTGLWRDVGITAFP